MKEYTIQDLKEAYDRGYTKGYNEGFEDSEDALLEAQREEDELGSWGEWGEWCESEEDIWFSDEDGDDDNIM